MQVKDIMTKKVITVHSYTPIHEVARLLFEYNLTGMPVIDDDQRIRGIITEYDLMSREKHIHIPTFLELMQEFKIKDDKKIKKKIKEIGNLEVRDLMTSPVVTVHPRTGVEEAARIFTERHINPLPVVDEHNQLVGIISRADVVKLFQMKQNLILTNKSHK